MGSSKDCLRRLMRKHGQVAVFVEADLCSAECVGIDAALRGTRHDALEPGARVSGPLISSKTSARR